MRRVLAVVVAIALIGGAYLYRTRDDDGDGGNRRSNDGPLTLVCTTELADICQAIAEDDSRVRLTVEPAWRTFDALLQEVPEAPDAWLAAGPWPQLVEEERSRRNLNKLFEATEPLASSELVAIIATDKLAALECASAPTWGCLAGAFTGARTGARLRLGMPDPSEEATGTHVIAAAVGSVIGEPDYSRDDFRGLPPESLAAGTAEGVSAATQSGRSSVELFFGNSGGAFLDAWAATAAEIDNLYKDAVRRPSLTRVQPTPKAIVSVTLGSTRANLDEGSIREALRNGGWTGTVPAATEDGLPSPGVLVALSEVIR